MSGRSVTDYVLACRALLHVLRRHGPLPSGIVMMLPATRCLNAEGRAVSAVSVAWTAHGESVTVETTP